MEAQPVASPADLKLLESKLLGLQAIAFDVDGVLTDGGILWGPNGEEWKRFHFSDIMGISLARRLGLTMALISGEPSPLVDRYAEKMRIKHVVKGCRDKATAFRDFADKHRIPIENCGFMGDDINDLPAMRVAGFSAAPANAAPEVLAHVDFRCTRMGGNGAVRELIDAMLAARSLDPGEVFTRRPPD
jgi:3-deoxy-D-manno-octulosonate 8-phosphate phosphatase (KDO 8-P phosphatase)